MLPTGWCANLQFVRTDDGMSNLEYHDYSAWVIYDAGGSARSFAGYWSVIGDGTNVTFIDDINNAPPCFTAGQKVRCAGGQMVPIEKLTIGSLVETRDNGPLPVRWIGSSLVTGETLRQFPNRRPVKSAKDALGDHPEFSVSQQHRMFHDGAEERLIPAKFLVDGDRIAIDDAVDEVTYFHIMFDSHQIVEVDGFWSESFYPGEYIMGAVEPQVAEEIRFFFPDLEAETAQDAYGPLCRKPVKKREVQLLLGQPG